MRELKINTATGKAFHLAKGMSSPCAVWSLAWEQEAEAELGTRVEQREAVEKGKHLSL